MKSIVRIIRGLTVLRLAGLVSAGILVLAGPARVHAEISFYSSPGESETTFLQAIAGAELTLLGRESFPSVGSEQSGGTPGALLAPGVAAGSLFPTGSDTTLGLLFQTNSLGSNPSAPSPGGTLFAVGPTSESQRTWIGPNLASDSLDVIVDPPGYRGLSRAFSFAVRTTGGSSVAVRLYDNENTLLASVNFSSADLGRIGILSTNNALFRINMHAPGGYLDVAALDLYVGEGGSGSSAALTELIEEYFPGADPQTFEWTADHNGSGIATLAELAYGNDPAVWGGVRFQPEFVSGPDPLILTHPLDRTVDGVIDVEVEWSLDLVDWTSARPGVDGVTRVVESEAYRAASAGVSAVDRVRMSIPAVTGSPAFFRLRVRALP